MLLGLFEVVLKALFELRIGGALDEFGERFQDLVFCVVDVLEPVGEEVFKRLDVLGESPIGVLVGRRQEALVYNR